MATGLTFQVAAYPDCAPELIEFRNDNRSVRRDRAYFDWRYGARPCTEPPIVIWAEMGGRRVGALTVFPHDFHIIDRERPVGVLGDISVGEEHRGSGIAGAMFDYIAQVEPLRKLYGCVVLPNEGAARALRRSGWRDASPIRRFAKVLDFRSRFAHRSAANPLRTLARPIDLLLRRFTYEGVYRQGSHQCALVSHIGDAFDEVWNKADKQGKVLAVRNARYLRWRYQHHPLNSYRVLAIMDRGEQCGYAMYRLAGGVCFVEDVFTRDPGREAAHVIGLLLKHLREQSHVSSVSVSINRSPLNFPWRRFGFSRRADFQRVMTSHGSPAATGSTAHPTEGWHITAGDKDV